MSHYQTIIDKIDLNKFQCDFVDIRIEESCITNIMFHKNELIESSINPSAGVFIRIYKNGQWFYESSTDCNNIEDQINKLIAFGEQFSKQTSILKSFTNNGKYEFIKNQNNRLDKISILDKIHYLTHYAKVCMGIPNIIDHRIRYSDIYKIKYYKNSAKTEFAYDFNQGGFSVSANLKDGENMFTDLFSHYISDIENLKNLEQKISNHFLESQNFLKAQTINPGKYPVILSPKIVGVFTHESFGHKSEADFMLGDPQSINEWKIGKSVGANLLSIVDSGMHSNTSGYCPIDDEGTLAHKTYLIKNGKLAGRLHSKTTADELGEEPTGNSRAINFEWEPIVRMTSTYIEAGKDTLEDLFKKAPHGTIFLDGVKHGSGTSTFTIAPIRAYKVENGKLTTPLRVALISGSVFETLNQIVSIADDFKLDSSALGGCGKMAQWPLPVSTGGPTILVSEMQLS